jgi:hypothetical protein
LSYDLMVFDPLEAPRDRAHFIEWYRLTTEWSEGHDYNDPKETAPALRAWYEDIRRIFPNMNGPGAPSDEEIGKFGHRMADYSFAHHAIYVTFAWSVAEDAYQTVRETAVAHKVGFYDVSGDEGDGEIYFPGDHLRPPSQGAWRSVAHDFESGDVSKYVPDSLKTERSATTPAGESSEHPRRP